MGALPRDPLQFAVVREDPRIEASLFTEQLPDHALLIGSGGCTALHLRAKFPQTAITLVEPNSAQTEHLNRKLRALQHLEPSAFNVGTDDVGGLHECGNFERLFRLLRTVLDVFVISATDRAARCADPDADWDDVVTHPYWPIAFVTAFDDALLTTMFGPAAVQHATPGSYPDYFRTRIEAGLRADDRARNPWLHHVLLGAYINDRSAWPPFLAAPPTDLEPFDTRTTDLQGVESFAPFDFVQLSNVLDWTDDDGCRALARRLGDDLAPGARILWRQLNDPRDLVGYFGASFEFSAPRDADLAEHERSLFYDQVHLGTHR